jgi:hypothetical protein
MPRRSTRSRPSPIRCASSSGRSASTSRSSSRARSRQRSGARSAQRADELIAASDGELGDLYGERIAAFRQIALERGAAGAPAEKVAKVVLEALSAERPHTRYLIGRDARLRAGFERLPDRLRDRIYERVLLKR